MSGRVGLELGPEVIRGIVASSWRDAPARTIEVPWNPSDPASAIDALRSEHPSPGALWIAVGLGFLHVARVQLPPTAPEAREQMVAIEPDRFFPSTERLQVALADGGDTAFAVNADWLEQVVRALEGHTAGVTAAAAQVRTALTGTTPPADLLERHDALTNLINLADASAVELAAAAGGLRDHRGHHHGQPFAASRVTSGHLPRRRSRQPTVA